MTVTFLAMIELIFFMETHTMLSFVFFFDENSGDITHQLCVTKCDGSLLYSCKI